MIVSRESLDSAAKRLRLRIFKQSKRGMNFVFNAAASAQGSLEWYGDRGRPRHGRLRPSSDAADRRPARDRELARSDQPLPEKLAELGVDYGLDLLQKITGVDPKQAFDDARARLLGLFAEWDKLPEACRAPSGSSSKRRPQEGRSRGAAAGARRHRQGRARDIPEDRGEADCVRRFFSEAHRRHQQRRSTAFSVSSPTPTRSAGSGLAETTAKLLDPTRHAKTLENLQAQLERRLGLEAIRKGITAAEFDNVDAWLKTKPLGVLGRRINFAALQEIREAVVDILAKRNDFISKR